MTKVEPSDRHISSFPQQSWVLYAKTGHLDKLK